MKIGILGSGNVAQSLGAGLLKHGHQVALGTGSPAKLADWSAQHPKARVGSFADAAEFGELVILSVKGKAAVEAVQAAGAQRLAGKVVIDTTNPIADAAPVDGVLQFFTGPNESLLEQLQREFPQIRFVKAFNSVGAAHMVDPSFQGGPPTMFIAGNDEAARKTVSGIVRELGWDVADMGTATAARAIEPLCMLWCIPGLARNEWTHAFRLLKRS
ncbi:MAG TPA: NAD(P)-binding domain-containing protein [Albitalea sp.]|uniref:NADPH-dependent F420 reductase n=1 Tax=Piscinibacter sp. TaxID=1903157 RepID=UPI002ED13E93